jgi:hypothetical protein
MPVEGNEPHADSLFGVEPEGAQLVTAFAPDFATVWRPEPSNLPQGAAYRSKADLLLYGGAAGGGKTDLLIGLAMTQHRRSIIFRREYAQLRAIIDRTAEIHGSRDGFNGQDKVWRFADNRMLEFGACQHVGDEQAFQGRPHDLKAFDEITHFTEAQFRFLAGWLRTTRAGQRCRILAAGNPPTTPEGEWVRRYWGPWLDPAHPNKARPGELRWYAMIDGKDTEVSGPEPVEHDGEIIVPKSRTFIPSRVEDNPFLMETGYKAQLQSLPEPLRSMMLRGDFAAGTDDDPWQVIPTVWVERAQKRWTAAPPDEMDTLGADIARGGQAQTVLTPRHGEWFGEQIVYPGKATPDGPAAAALIVAAMRGNACCNIDVIGVGSSVYDHLRLLRVNVQAMHGAERSDMRDRSGKLRFANKRAQWWWQMREALDPAYGDYVALPPDRELLADLCAPKWKLTSGGILIESKEDLIERRSTTRPRPTRPAMSATH